MYPQGLPWSLGVKSPAAEAGDTGLVPGREYPTCLGARSPGTAAAGPVHLGARAPRQEKPPLWEARAPDCRVPLLAATRERASSTENPARAK